MITKQQLDMIDDNITNCDACNVRKHSSPIVPHYYPDLDNRHIDLMVIADKVSREENTCLTAWFDRDKEYVSRLIHSIFSSKLTYFTYLIKCFTEPSIHLNKKTINTCYKTHLLEETKILRPKFILTMGNLSAKLLLADYTKKPKIGDIFINDNMALGYWKSPFNIFNEGKKKEQLFINFLNKIKSTISVI